MSKIQVMDEVLANKIAAGEVVEKCMNVVKELVENSIDAEATEITINLVDSGVKEITVIDNGIGMDEEDAKKAFERHATSKLKKLDDLFNIESLGFRGEALPSIASVSNVRLKTSDGKVGTEVTISGGKDLKVKRSDLQIGTSITVTDLFYNTPVRLKYLKNLYVELSYIVEYVNKMALSYPNIKFTLINNDKVLLQTDGNGDQLKVVYEIYGVDITKKMIPISNENDDYYIHGFISYPEVTKGNRNSITTLVNGRVIKNNELNKCIVDCYHTYIHKDRYPVIILNIDVDPILVDINIHPTKMDIKFSKLDTLKDLLIKTITTTLEGLTLIPEVSVRDSYSVSEVHKQIYNKKEEVEEPKEEIKYEEIKLDFDVQEEKKELKKEEQELKEELPFEVEVEDEKVARIKKMHPIGVVMLTYIVAENEDGMYLIDQHAAAERINYEKILKELQEEKQVIDLLIPIKIELRKDEFILAKERLHLLEDYGFVFDEFGFNTILVRSHPVWVDETRAEDIIRKLVDLIIDKKDFDFDQFVWRMAATAACRMSVMAGDYISIEDQEWILENIRYCDNPFTCPHGRPTIITYTKYELEKLFKRQLD
ncbi:MAG: DNA mismatch repair endonuclease MutL [Bacilli bacterium]|nr:DNA mismatch repair endonuclease MutL [Bacilli bacterium]MBR6137424.1 DNA mismatch repair endonuclease MutL [Bacilli bacterium]